MGKTMEKQHTDHIGNFLILFGEYPTPVKMTARDGSSLLFSFKNLARFTQV